MKLEEKTLESTVTYAGRVFTATMDKIILPDGRYGTREKVHHTGGVGVLAICEDGTVPMVRQYRYGAGKVMLEIPAGKTERGEDPEECGKRELAEECGLKSDVFESLGMVTPTPAYCGEVIHLFLARNLSKTEARLDDDEFLEVEYVPFERAVEMAASGEIDDAKTVAALFRRYYACQKQF